MQSYEAASGVGAARRQLDFLWLEITPKCNLECRHCYAESSPKRELSGDMGLSDWLRMLGDAAEAGCRAVQFIGGEPTLHPHLPEMIAHADSLGYKHIEVFTNATAIRPKLLESFVSARVQIATSFYSDDGSTHDQITQHIGSFRRTVAGIRQCIEAGLQVRAGIVETPLNTGHALNAAKLLAELGVKSIRVDRQREIGRGLAHAANADSMSSLCGQCRGTLCVTASGAMFPCVFSRFVQVGNARVGIRSALSSRELDRFCVELESIQRDLAKAGDGLRDVFAGALNDPHGCDPKTCSPGRDFQRCQPMGRCGPSHASGTVGPKANWKPLNVSFGQFQ